MVTRGYGFTVSDIDWSSPADLEPYAKAHAIERQEQDVLAHMWWGAYGLNAVAVAVEHCLAGKKARSKYADEPVLKRLEEQNKPMSEEKLRKQRELFVAKMQVMQANFELSHNTKQK